MKKLVEQIKVWLKDAKEGKQVSDKDLTAAVVLDVEDIKAYLDTDDGKKLILPRIDQAVSKGIDTFKTNNLDKMVEELYNKQHPALTDAQKEMAKISSDLASEKTARVRSELRSKLLSEATKRELPVGMIDLLIGADEETSLKNLDLYGTVHVDSLTAAVEKKLAAGGRLPAGGGEPPKTFTKEQMKDANFVNENWEDVKGAMSTGTIK